MSLLGDMFGKPVHGLISSDLSLPIPNAKVGIEVELEEWNGRAQIKNWIPKADESLRNNGVEFVTNGGMCGKAITQCVNDICLYALENNWSEGYPRAGIHIHLDVTDLDMRKGELAKLVAHYTMIEHAMFGYAGEWRKECGYCVPFDVGQEDFRTLGRFLYTADLTNGEAAEYASGLSKYQALNLKPLTEFGTIEFRALPTTFDVVRIMNWIKIILAIKKAAISSDPRPPLRLLSDLGPHDYVKWLLGDLADILMPFVNVNSIWDAVDDSMAIMAFGDSKPLQVDWSKLPTPNPILEAKKAKLLATAAKKQPSAAKTGLERILYG